MLRSQKLLERRTNQFHRAGLLYLGALREVFVITLAVGLVTTSLWHANSLLNMHLSAQTSDTVNADVMPVMNLAVDQTHLTLFTHAMTGKLSQISLETGTLYSKPVPKDLVSVAMSSHASTIAMLEEWAEEGRVHHRVDVIREDQVVVSEELNLEPFTDASIYISRDGNIVMSFSSQGEGIGWDLTKSEPRRWTINVGSVSHMNGLSPDGQKLFVASKNGSPFICDAQSGEARIPLVELTRSCQCVTWSADGTRLSVGDMSGGVHVFDSSTGHRIWNEKIHLEFARSVAFSNDSEMLAVGGFDETIRIWNLSKTDQEPIRLKGQRGVIRSLVFTDSNDKLISGSFNGTIFEWSLANQTCIRKFQ